MIFSSIWLKKIFIDLKWRKEPLTNILQTQKPKELNCFIQCPSWSWHCKTLDLNSYFLYSLFCLYYTFAPQTGCCILFFLSVVVGILPSHFRTWIICSSFPFWNICKIYLFHFYPHNSSRALIILCWDA